MTAAEPLPPDLPHRPASRFVEAAGLRWHVQLVGQGAPLLLLHGTGAASFSFAPLVERLRHRFTCVVPDLPGHGWTAVPPAEGLSLPGMAGGVAALLAALGLRPVLVAGHSAGAAIGARLLLDGLPARGLAGLAPAIRLPSNPREVPGWALAAWLGEREWIARLAAWYCDAPARVRATLRRVAPRLPEAQVAWYHRVLRRAGHQHAVFSMMARWDVRPVRAALRAVPVPALLVAGGRDPWFPPPVVTALAAEFREATAVALPDCGHLVHEEDPDAVAGHLLAFADRVRA